MPRKLSSPLRRTVTTPIPPKPIPVKSTAAYLTPGVYMAEIPSAVRSISATPTDVALFIGQTAIGAPLVPQTCTSDSEFAAHFGTGGATDALEHYIRLFFLNGGQRSVVVKLPGTAPADYAAAFAAVTAAGIRFNLLVLVPEDPAAVDVHYAAASEFCLQHEALLLMDPPPAWTRAAIAANDAPGHFPGVLGDYAAVYYPRLNLADGRTIGPAGAVAGVIARTDRRAGVWKAPAGLEAEIRGAVPPADPLTNGELDLLNPAGINAIHVVRSNVVIWGARTWANRGDFRYIPVRRLASHITTSLRDGLAWVATETNQPALWTTIRSSTETFLFGLFRLGALAGSTQRDAYYVRCDRSTMTAADEAAGRIILEVGIAPLKPAEFVALRLVLSAAS